MHARNSGGHNSTSKTRRLRGLLVSRELSTSFADIPTSQLPWSSTISDSAIFRSSRRRTRANFERSTSPSSCNGYVESHSAPMPNSNQVLSHKTTMRCELQNPILIQDTKVRWQCQEFYDFCENRQQIWSLMNESLKSWWPHACMERAYQNGSVFWFLWQAWSNSWILEVWRSWRSDNRGPYSILPERLLVRRFLYLHSVIWVRRFWMDQL